MALLQRITTPFAALLPDLNNVPQQRQAVGAIVASLILHLLLLICIATLAGLMPEMHGEMPNPKALEQPPQPLELTVMDLAPPQAEEIISAEELKARAQRPVIDSTGLTPSAEKPKEALFESDVDMQAASELPATGDAPLPSQEGRKRAFTHFKDQELLLGSTAKPPQPAALPEPIFQPQPVPPSATAAPRPDEPTPEPATAPSQPKPPLLPEVLKANDQEIAVAAKMTEVPEGPITRLTPATPAFRSRLLPATPPPKPVPDRPSEERTEMAKLTPPAASPSSPAGFQDEQTKTQVNGSITRRGQAAVDAVRTPLGVYKQNVKAAVGSRWYFYMKQRMGLYPPGSATFSYAITKDGRMVDVRMVSNTSNASFALLCEECIREAKLAPPPEEALATTNDGKLEDVFTFNNNVD